MPPFSSCEITRLAVLIGTAKPMPTLPLPLPPVSICELMPITWPCALSSGPPELPGLIGASVWMTLSIVKPLGAVIERCSAETTPVVSVRSRPNGLPIASVGSPTWTPRGVTERQRVSVQPVGRDAQHREIVGGVLADHLRFDGLAGVELTVTLTAFSTTW